AARDAAAQAPVLVGVLQELDDLRQLLLRLVDSGHVGEGDPRLGRLVAARPRPAERAQHPLGVPGAAHEPEEEEEEEKRRPEAEEQVLPPWRAGVERLGVDDDAVLDEELRERVRVREGRDFGPEAAGLRRLAVARRLLEEPLDRRPLRRDRLDVALPDLLE